MIHVAKEYTRLKVALAIPTGTPIMLEKEITDIPPLAADKTRSCQSDQMQQYVF